MSIGIQLIRQVSRGHMPGDTQFYTVHVILSPEESFLVLLSGGGEEASGRSENDIKEVSTAHSGSVFGRPIQVIEVTRLTTARRVATNFA
jgi:hypothetical protein